MTAQERAEILITLRDIMKESVRLYKANNHGAYEAGRVDGVKWCVDAIREII